MGKEVERKFLVESAAISTLIAGRPYRRIVQGYLSVSPVVRVRISGNDAWLTVKSTDAGIERDEWEYVIHRQDAEEMLKRTRGRVIVKTRYELGSESDATQLFLDIFHHENHGLVLLEVELQDKDVKWAPPVWIRREVTDDETFRNDRLALNPVLSWSVALREQLDKANPYQR